MKRFIIGQKFTANSDGKRYATVVQIDDDGRKAWVEVRSKDGKLLDSAWVNHSEFFRAWSETA